MQSALNRMILNNKRIFLRADLNVPIYNNNITSDHRLRMLLPTLDLLQNAGGRIIIGTHRGRPQGHEKELSTRILAEWFTTNGYPCSYTPDLQSAYQRCKTMSAGQILILENLRFFPGECTQDTAFAQQLANMADIYVNDAFGTLHRDDTSLTVLPTLFAPENKTIGLLVEKELTMLDTILQKPKRPFVVILGGGKTASKLSFIRHLIDHADTILVCPAVAFTFLHAQGVPVGASPVDLSLLKESQEILKYAGKVGCSIKLPSDFQVTNTTLTGVVLHESKQVLEEGEFGSSIGTQTIARYITHIKQAKTIFFNGSFGTPENPVTMKGMQTLIKTIADSKGISIVGGGDSVDAVQRWGLAPSINHLSTGGGATLAYISGQPLPGLVALKRSLEYWAKTKKRYPV